MKWLLLPLGTIGLAVATIVLLNYLSSEGRAYEQAATKAAYDNRADTQDKIIRCIRTPGTVVQTENCIAQAEQAAREYEGEQRDLAAQRQSAWWAEIMGWAAVFAAVLSAVGVALIYRTFQETLSQGAEVARSVNQATRSADAMEGVKDAMTINANQVVKSVEMQRRFGQMQLRPYLTVLVGEGVWQDELNNFEIQPKIWNAGHTPAKDVRWRIACDIVPAKTYDRFNFPLPKEVSREKMIVAPHRDYHLSAILPYRVSDEEAGRITLGAADKALIVWGCLSYRDGLGQRYWTTFAQQVWWVPIRDGEGNVTATALRGRFLTKHNRGN